MVNSPKKSDSKIKYFCHICKRDFVSKAKIYKSAYRAHTGRSKFHKEKSALLYPSQSRNGKSREKELDDSVDDDIELEDDNEIGGENNMDDNDYEAFDDTPAGNEVDVAGEESDDELKDDVDERDEDESEVL